MAWSCRDTRRSIALVAVWHRCRRTRILPAGTTERTLPVLYSATTIVVNSILAIVLDSSSTIVLCPSTTPVLDPSSTAISGTCDTSGTVTMVAELTTIPAVMHTNVPISGCAEMFSASVVVAAVAMDVPSMSTAIGGIKGRTSEVEVVTVRIAGIDAEVPVACLPVERTIEIGGCDIGLPLPVVKDITQIEVTALPIGAEHISAACHSHQIVKVNLIGSLVLLVCEVQLVGHLIRQEQSLVTGLLETHCICRNRHGQHGNQGHHHLFHNRIVLIVRHQFYYFTVQSNGFFHMFAKEKP